MSLLWRARLINAALLVIASAATALCYVELDRPDPVQLQARRQHLLPIYRADEVQRVVVVSDGQRTVIERGASAAPPPEAEEGSPLPGLAPADEDEPPPGPRWVLAEPFETDADPAAVDKLLSTLRYATWLRELEEPPPGGFGPTAAPPSPAVTPPGDAGALPAGPTDSGASPTAAAAGSVAPGAALLEVDMGSVGYRLTLGGLSVSPSDSRYVRLERLGPGSSRPRYFVIGPRLVREVFVDGDVFRGRQIVPYSKRSIRQLILSSAAGVRRIARTDGVFRFDGMEEGQRVERRGLDRIFLALARSVADPLIDVNVARAALSVQSSIHISLLPLDPDRPEASLEFGGDCPGQPGKALALRHLPEPIAGCVSRGVVAALREPAEVLIDRGLFSLGQDEIDTLRIQAHERGLELVRRGGGFQMRRSGAGAELVDVEREVAEDRLRRILGLRGDLLTGRHKPSGSAAFSGARVTVESSAVPGKERVVETVLVSKPRKAGSVWVHRESDGAVLLLSAREALALEPDSTLLKSRQIFDYSLSQVRGIRIERGRDSQALKRSEAGAVELVAPRGYSVDAGLAAELTDTVRNIEASRWVMDTTTKAFGLAKPDAVVTLELEVDGRELTRTLRIGDAAPGGYYASVDRNPGLFILPRRVWRVLDTWLIDRGVFRAEAESIHEISIDVRKRGKLLVRRVGGVLTVLKSPETFDPDALPDLVHALEDMHPEAAVHLGKPARGEGLRRPPVSVKVRRRSEKNVGMSALSYTIGSRDSFDGASVYYARRSGVNAVYALPRMQVQALLDLF